MKLRSEYRKTQIHDTSKLDIPAGGGRFEVAKYQQDWIVGTTFAIRPDVVVKGEYHWSESQLLETHVQPIGAPSRSVNYGIVWMSVSF